MQLVSPKLVSNTMAFIEAPKFCAITIEISENNSAAPVQMYELYGLFSGAVAPR